MNSKPEIAYSLRKAMEFYRELGFNFLPVRLELKYERAEVRKRESAKTQKIGRENESSMTSELKEKALKVLSDEIGDCTRCKLSGNRKNIVFGEGSSHAEIMFIGEGPGRDEDIKARPFVGEAGQLLTRMIEKMGMKREDIYIANVVKCRPPNNRAPDEEEIATCMPFLERQIELIKPKVIVGLGNISTQSLLRIRTAISKTRGHFLAYNNIPFMPTFHPAYLLRNPKDKWLTWDDMQKVLERLKA